MSSITIKNIIIRYLIFLFKDWENKQSFFLLLIFWNFFLSSKAIFYHLKKKFQDDRTNIAYLTSLYVWVILGLFFAKVFGKTLIKSVILNIFSSNFVKTHNLGSLTRKKCLRRSFIKN